MSPYRQMVYITTGIIIFSIINFLPSPEPLKIGKEVIRLSPNGKLCLGLLAAAVFLWITEALPFHITALGAMLIGLVVLTLVDAIPLVGTILVVLVGLVSAGAALLSRFGSREASEHHA